MDNLDILRDENFDSSIVPDKWYYFEAMDRCNIIMSHITEALCNHPALEIDEAKMAQDAINSIMEIYQRMSCKLNKVI